MGSNVTSPALSDAAPPVTLSMPVTVRASSSTSLSLPTMSNAVTTSWLSSLVVAASSVATGASLTHATFTLACAVDVPPAPSLTV